MRKLIVLLRKKILVLAALLLFGVLLLCGTFVRGALPVFRPSGVPERSVIVIDAGHGGEDGGAVAADGTVESGLNLAIARRVRECGVYCEVKSYTTPLAEL